MSKQKSFYYRQGDVIILPVEEIPEGAHAISRDDQGRIVLAQGETTGHAHVITMPEIKWIEVAGERYLSSDKPIQITHEEHDMITLPAGNYIVGVQVEYDPERERIVLD